MRATTRTAGRLVGNVLLKESKQVPKREDAVNLVAKLYQHRKHILQNVAAQPKRDVENSEIFYVNDWHVNTIERFLTRQFYTIATMIE
jgi:hypothetical protein